MSQSFEKKTELSQVAAAVKADVVAVLSGSSKIPKSFVIPKYRPVIEVKQVNMPAKLQISSSRDQIVLTDYHRRKIQMQKYDFDCKFKNACDFKPFKPSSQPQNNFPVTHMCKSIRSVYNSTQPSSHSIKDYRNFIFNLNNSNRNFNRVPHVPMKSFQTYEHRERGYRQVFEIQSEKGPVPFPSKNSRISDGQQQPRISETGSMVQSDSCLLRSFGLPQSDYEKSSMSESHLQVKSSKDLDRLYKRISLEDLFSSGDPDKSAKSSNLMNIPPFRSDVKLGPISNSFVTPTDHLKHILKIGTDGNQAATNGERVKYQVPFPNKVEKTRISTGCQTEDTDDRCWNRTASETSLKFTESRNNNVTSAIKAPIAESTNKKKATVNRYGLAGKNDLQSDLKMINVLSADDSVEFQSQNNKFQVEDKGSANNNTEQVNDVTQKDEEKGLAKKGSRKKGKTNRSKLKGELKNDPEVSCCDKCRKNIDIMNFSENEMQFDVVKQNSAGTNVNNTKRLADMKAFEEPAKTQPGQVKEIEKENDKIQVKAVLLDPIKSKPIIEDGVVKNSYRAKKPKPKSAYKDVFKEFSRSKDFSTSSTNKSPRNLSDVAYYKEDCAIQKHVSDYKITPVSKPFNFYPVNRSSSDTSQRVKSLKSDYNSLLRYKMQRPKKQYRRFEKPNISEDESVVKVQPINEDILCKSSQEFRSKQQDDETRIPSDLHSVKYLESNKEDQNIHGPHLHTNCNSIDLPRHPKKAESDPMQTGQEMSPAKVQQQYKATLDAKNVHDNLTTTPVFDTSLKSHIKPAFLKPNGTYEKPPAIDSIKPFPKVKERFVHNANAPFQENWNSPTNPKETLKNKSDIASTG